MYTVSFRLHRNSTDFLVRCRCENRFGWRSIVVPYLLQVWSGRWNKNAGLWVVKEQL